MKRVVMTFVFACAACMLAVPSVVAQGFAPSLATTPAASLELPQAVKAAIPPQAPTPAASQEAAPQTVKAAIPPQATRPTAATPRPVELSPQERPTPATFEDIPNVRVDVTISYQVGQAAPVKRSASLVVASSNDSGSLRSGNQVAVPSTTFTPMAVPARAEANTASTPPPAAPMTSYNYRSVGLNVDARSVRVSGNKARMTLSVEFSAVDEKAGEPNKTGPSYPSFPTFSQNLSIVLDNGKPIVIAQTSDVVDNVPRTQSVEVKATILR